MSNQAFWVRRSLCILACAGLSLSWVIAAQGATVTINPVKDNSIYAGVDPGTGEDFTLNRCGAVKASGGIAIQ